MKRGGPASCPLCGYDLAGLAPTDCICPECGGALADLRRHLADTSGIRWRSIAAALAIWPVWLGLWLILGGELAMETAALPVRVTAAATWFGSVVLAVAMTRPAMPRYRRWELLVPTVVIAASLSLIPLGLAWVASWLMAAASC